MAAGLPRRVNPAKARVNRKANRKASRKANQVANRDQRASHRAAMVQKADPAAIGQVTAKVKAIASPGRPAIPPADLAAIRRAAQAVTHRHRQAIRMILRQVTPTIHQQASRIVRASATPIANRRANLLHPTAARASPAIRHGSGLVDGSSLKVIVPKLATHRVDRVGTTVKLWRWQHDALSQSD